MIGLSLTCLWTLAALAVDARSIDLSEGVVVVPESLSHREQKGLDLLLDEVEVRSNIRWKVVDESQSAESSPRIALVPLRPGKDPSSREITKPPAEGFTIQTTMPPKARVEIMGDERGLLFGIGYLLRQLRIEPGKIQLPKPIHLTSHPTTKIRGHQLGYRPKTNSYDAWDLPQWEQYIRDLAVFGTNAIELVPPKSDDDDLSPHFPRPKMEMMTGMSKLADDYGLDVWIWYPAIDGDYTDPKVVEQSLREWGDVLSRLPRVDAIFVPTGDPGNTRPGLLMPMLEKQAEQLRRIHPRATVWISIQGLIKPWFDEMIELLAKEPDWLAGICYGPQTRVSLPELKRLIPARYSFRRYPDITHCIWCQYPVPDWDLSFALTLGREPINPRPLDQSTIFRAFDEYADGFITYSEGCNDDVNKFIWSGLGWNVDQAPADILREYARYFLGDAWADSFSEGLLLLEQNWRGPVHQNEGILRTLAHFQRIEQSATPRLRQNWRFQQALYRAYYDALVYRRARQEMELEAQAMRSLAGSATVGSLPAMHEAQVILAKSRSSPAAPELRARVIELADELFRSIGMQLSVPKYRAIALWRGANLDSIDVPLNNADWLTSQMEQIRQLPQEPDRQAKLAELLSLGQAPSGGYYDDLGNPLAQPHLVRSPDYTLDPASLRSPYVGFQPEPGLRRSWCTYADGLFDVPVLLKYEGLDPSKQYKVRIVYASESRQRPVRLTTDDGLEIHPLMDRPMPPRPIERSIPPEATRDGTLVLEFRSDPERGGNGRGPQVADVWLMPIE